MLEWLGFGGLKTDLHDKQLGERMAGRLDDKVAIVTGGGSG